MKGILPQLVRYAWARRASIRDFYLALAALVSPVQNNNFSHRTLQYINLLYVSPSPSNLVQAVVQGLPSLNVCLRNRLFLNVSPVIRIQTGGGGGIKYGEVRDKTIIFTVIFILQRDLSSLGRYVFGSEISYNKPPPRLPGLGC